VPGRRRALDLQPVLGQPPMSARSVTSPDTTSAPTSHATTTTSAASGGSRAAIPPPNGLSPEVLATTTALAALNGMYFTMSGRKSVAKLSAI